MNDHPPYYVYDGAGDRVGETNSQGTPTAAFIYDINHRLLTQTNTGTYQIVRANIYAGSLYMAEDSPDPVHNCSPSATATQLRFTDQVGSLRSLWDYCYVNYTASWDSFPYGDGATTLDGGDAGPNYGGMLFTGKERDPESNNDFFGARYYSSIQGRFMSPDFSEQPDTVPYAEFENPQTLNLYSYGNNNPLTNNDPDGHSVNVCTTGSDGSQQCTLLSNDQYQASQQGNGSLNVPTLNQVGSNSSNGTFNATAITDGSGNTVGTATYSPDNPGIDPYVGNNMAGYNQLSNTSRVVTAGTALYAGAYAGAFFGPMGAAGIANLANTLRAGMTIGSYVLSAHAAEQAEARGVTLSEIEDAVQGVAKGNPQNGYDSVQRFYTSSCEVRVNKITGVIVTVISKVSR